MTSKGNSGAHEKTAGVVAFAAGGAALAGGLVWHLVEPTGPRDVARFELHPLLAPGLGGVGLRGSF